MNGTILTSVFVAVTAAEIRSMTQGHPTMRPVIGGFITGLFLFGIDSIDSTVASALAVFIMVSSLLVNGSELFGTVNRVIG